MLRQKDGEHLERGCTLIVSCKPPAKVPRRTLTPFPLYKTKP